MLASAAMEGWIPSTRLWIFTLLFSGIFARKSQILYMDSKRECSSKRVVYLGGAVVYSHTNQNKEVYRDHIECKITFKAEQKDSKLMMKVVSLDLPDQAYNKLCNDALYVYDANSIFGRTVKEAGGMGGLCGDQPPNIIYSSSEYLTLYFRTDQGGPAGHGFKLIITAFTNAMKDEYQSYSFCSPAQFKCQNSNMCIDRDLLCDRVDNCGDYSDELPDSYSQCKDLEDKGIVTEFLSLGITAAIAITVGSVVLVVVCVVCIVCCCCKSLKRKRQETNCTTTTTTTTSVTINNGAPLGAYSQGYHPMQPVSHPMQQGMTFSPYPPHRNSYSQNSTFSSHPPPSYHRSFTPTSSKSGRSQHSADSTVKYPLQYDKEAVIMPAHL